MNYKEIGTRIKPKYDKTHHEFSKADKAFRKACEDSGCPPTRRQASKFRRQRGRAWAASRNQPVDTPYYSGGSLVS